MTIIFLHLMTAWTGYPPRAFAAFLPRTCLRSKDGAGKDGGTREDDDRSHDSSGRTIISADWRSY